MPPERVIANIAELADALARRMEALARQAIRERGRFSVALAGGSVATRFFPRLALASVPWDHTDFFWVDERAVAPDDPESNYGAAARLWLGPAGVPEECVHRMRGDEPDLERAARLYADDLARIAPRLDLVLLGVGPDGHVASLFPGHAALEETVRDVVAVHDAPKPPPRRLTITLPALQRSRLLVVAAFGAEKAPVIRELFTAPHSALPVARAVRGAERALVLVDREAAS